MIEIKNNDQTEQIVELNNKSVKKSDMSSNMSRIKRIVKNICESNEDALNNDIILYIDYLRITKQAEVNEKDNRIIISIDKETLKKGNITKPESTSRSRRELHKDGELQYSEDTEQQRERFSKEFREYFKKDIVESENYDKRRNEWMV